MQTYYENRTSDYIACRDSRFTEIALACQSHLHYHIELAFLLEGETRAVVDSQEYTMRAGDILVAFPNQIHRFVKNYSSTLKKISLHFFNDNEDENEDRMHHRNLFL